MSFTLGYTADTPNGQATRTLLVASNRTISLFPFGVLGLMIPFLIGLTKALLFQTKAQATNPTTNKEKRKQKKKC